MTCFSARGHSIMDIEKTVSYQLLEGTIGIPIIEIVSNNFEETPGYEGSAKKWGSNLHYSLLTIVEKWNNDLLGT